MMPFLHLTDSRVQATQRRARPAACLAVSLIALLLLLSPLLGQAAAADVLGVVLLRTAQPLGTSWLRPDPYTPMLWSAQRHATTLSLGSPAAGQHPSLAVRIGQRSANYLPPERSAPRLSLLWLLTGNWPAAASALQAAKRNGPPPQTDLESAYGYQALEGLAALDARDFKRAAAHLQRAAWLGGDRSARDGVYRALYVSLSGWYDQVASADGGSWRARYLSARYLDRAADPRAFDRLEQLRRDARPDAVPQDQADVRVRLARRALEQESTPEATTLIREAITFAPVAGPTAADEILVLQQLGLADEARGLSAALAARGPAYRLGTSKNQAWSVEPNSVGAYWGVVTNFAQAR
jgi:tetratricopeptide (TPR) repeat protein